MLFADDVIEAYDLFIKSRLKHEVFNIGGGPENTISLLEFLDILKENAKKKINIIFKDWRPSDQKVYISDISKVKEKLGWEPKISVRQGIQTLMDWAKENKDLFK
jgi:CDP-paratose 2-epimerase